MTESRPFNRLMEPSVLHIPCLKRKFVCIGCNYSQTIHIWVRTLDESNVGQASNNHHICVCHGTYATLASQLANWLAMLDISYVSWDAVRSLDCIIVSVCPWLYFFVLSDVSMVKTLLLLSLSKLACQDSWVKMYINDPCFILSQVFCLSTKQLTWVWTCYICWRTRLLQ